MCRTTMSAKTTNPNDAPTANNQFDAALDVAKAVAALDGVDDADALIPEGDYKESRLDGTLAWFVSPSTHLLRTNIEQPKADEVEGAKPGDAAPRVARTFLFEDALDEDEAADEDELTFAVTEQFENRYGDEKIVVETPAPWDTPDDMKPANEVVKSLEWDDYHYSFDKSRKAWTLDKSGAAELQELAADAGYSWFVEWAEDDEDEDEEHEDRLADLLAFVEDGDRVTVRYAKKNGNGTNTYEGEVVSHAFGNYTYSGKTGHTSRERHRTGTDGLVFEDDGGKSKRVKRDDEGDASLFSSGYYPYMGAVLAVSVEPNN